MTSHHPEKSLVLVVGAGASNEANLPVGAGLKQEIAKALDIRYERGNRTTGGDDIINDAFRMLAASDPGKGGINPYLKAARHIRNAMPQAISIDNFIDSHRTDEKIALCGKLAIARSILAAESTSYLKIAPGNAYNKMDFSGLETTWFNAFFQLLTENCQQADLPQRLSKVAIICFNYDRCIEHYLYSALQNYYGMSPDDTSEVMSNLDIHHPYGTVGKLPWQDQKEGCAFGAEPQPKQLLALAGELRTFTEGIDVKSSDISAIRGALTNSSRIAFLGFAFHRLNIGLLFPSLADGTNIRNCPVYATAHGISPADLQMITHELTNKGGIHSERINLRNDLKCSQLFREYWWSLSLQ